MKVISELGKTKKYFKNPVVAIGVFDGLHLGHRSLIKKVVSRSKAIGGTGIIITFYPHPVHVLNPAVDLSFVVSLEHRLKLIQEMGIDVCVMVRFTMQFAKLTARQFVEKLLVKAIKPKELFVGCDFRFGHGREGDVAALRRYGEAGGFKVHIVRFVKNREKIISSTHIRKLIGKGKIREVGYLLGRSFSVLGKVCRGDGRGKSLGFPTANMSLFPRLTLPPYGVYFTEVIFEGKAYSAVTNVGLRPSFKSKKRQINIESHILDFHKNIYGKTIEVRFLKRLRRERKFPSPNKFINQASRDIQKARQFFTRRK